MAQVKKIDRSDKDLTPKQRMFVDILVANWGEITYADACKKLNTIVKMRLIILQLHQDY
jgi:hypothetical protein